MTTPTIDTYSAYQEMFNHLNQELWAGQLPQVLLNMDRKRGALGFFWANRWAPSGEEKPAPAQVAHEISLNPEWLRRSPQDVASTLAHEMAHLWQQANGKPGKGGYHNRQWADEMRRIGLEPVSYDQPGKSTGYKCSHKVVPGGLFEKAFASLPVKAMPWACGRNLVKAEVDPKEVERAKSKNKVTYQCPSCETRAWGKPGLHLVCGDCDEEFVEVE